MSGMKRWMSDRTADRLTTILLLTLAFALCVAWILFATPANAWHPSESMHDNTHSQSVVCPPRGLTIDGVVTRVIDGDTIVVRSCVDYHVRLLDCWAPESRTRDLDEKQKGQRARRRMEELAAGKTVRVHIPGGDNLTELITLGRVLGRVWLRVDAQPVGPDLSSRMVSEKLATPRKQEPAK